MKHKYIFILSVMLMAAASLAAARPASAKTVNMVMWYPGEAGSTEEAQPVIDLLFEYVNKKISPDKIQGKYFNSVADGLTHIGSRKPAVAIISYAAWAQNKGRLQGDVILATLPLPGGAKTESYALVGLAGETARNLPIVSSEPLGISFVRSQLFPNIPVDAKIKESPQLIFSLKKIADGELKSQAILTPTEAATLDQISAEWATKIAVIERSKPVPSARVVLFDPAWGKAAAFKDALIKMNGDPEGREILNELRLAGFATP